MEIPPASTTGRRRSPCSAHQRSHYARVTQSHPHHGCVWCTGMSDPQATLPCRLSWYLEGAQSRPAYLCWPADALRLGVSDMSGALDRLRPPSLDRSATDRSARDALPGEGWGTSGKYRHFIIATKWMLLNKYANVHFTCFQWVSFKVCNVGFSHDYMCFICVSTMW